MKNYTVYMHINKINNKKYYGITGQKVEKRWGKNGNGYKFWIDKNGKKHGNEHFWNSICLYGWDNFEHIIIARGLTEEEAKWLEIELIREWNTINPKYGYNQSLGGESYNCSEKTRKKISENHADVSGYNNPMYGKTGKDNPRSKAVYVIELDMTFNSATECAKYLDCGKNSISSVANGKRKTINGYHIVYVKDKNDENINRIMSDNSKNGSKAVYIVELDMIFDTGRECAKYLDCSVHAISKVVTGVNKTCKGYHIIYAKDRNNEVA